MLIADLLEDDGVQVIAVLPGRFHPFHKGHASMYQALVSRFGRDNVWVATSNKTELPKSPFTFSEKLQMMRLAGIPADKVVETKNPYQVPELTYSMDPAKTIIVFGVSKKDMAEDPRFSFKPKKDGSPAYLQPLPSDIKQAKTMDQHGYITTVPTLDFKVLGKPMRSATEVRAMYGQADDETRQAIIKDLFGAYNNEVKSIMDNKLGNNVKTEDAPPGMEQWIKDRKPEFKKRYGDKWEEVLYATAWKQHNAKNESINESANDDTRAKLADIATKMAEKGASPEAIKAAINEFLKAQNESSNDIADKVSDYVLRTTGTGTTNAKGQKIIYTDDVELEEDWKKTLGAAALAITTATAPAAAQAFDWSDIFTPAISAEINQEIKNQLRGYDASSQNLTYQGTHQKQQAPSAASRFDNTTLQDQPTVDRTQESRLSGLVTAKTNEGIVGTALHKAEVWLKMKKFVRWYLDWRRNNPGQGVAGVKQASKILGLRPREYEHIINYLNKQVEKGELPKHLAITEESDYDAKMKALQDIMLDPHTAKDPDLKKELAKRLARLKQTKK